MGLLTANLKHLHQSWVFRLFWVVVGLIYAASAVGIVGRDASALSSALLLGFFLGMVLGSYQHHVRSRPFAFLLPRHNWVVPRQALVQSVTYGFLAALPCLLIPQTPLSRRLALSLVLFVLSTAACMGGSTLAMAAPAVVRFIGLLPLLIIGASLVSLPEIIETLIATHPLVLGLFGLVLIGWTWHVLGQRSLARQAVLSPALFAFEIFDMQKVREYQQHRVAKSRVLNREPRSNAFAQICLDGVHRHAPSDLSRCGYDVGYRLFGFLTIRGLACFLPVVTLLPIWMVYTGGGAMLYIILSVLVASLQLSTARAPLPMGRRQRFAVNAIRLFALCAGMGLLTWLVTVGTNAVVPTLPTLHLHRHALSPHALATHGPLITLTLLPLAYGMATLIGKRPALVLLCWMPLGGVGAFLAMQEAKLSPALWLSMPVFAVLLSLAAMRYHFLRRDLAA